MCAQIITSVCPDCVEVYLETIFPVIIHVGVGNVVEIVVNVEVGEDVEVEPELEFATAPAANVTIMVVALMIVCVMLLQLGWLMFPGNVVEDVLVFVTLAVMFCAETGINRKRMVAIPVRKAIALLRGVERCISAVLDSCLPCVWLGPAFPGLRRYHGLVERNGFMRGG